MADAQPVKEFLDPQLRDANSQNLEVGFALTFEDGLSMQSDAAEKLTERLARFASGAAYVSATAEARRNGACGANHPDRDAGVGSPV